MPLWSSSSSRKSTSDEHQHPESMHDNDAAASASQAAGTEWLAGHLNHLTAEQEGKLKEFKGVCKENGYYREAEEAREASHGDAAMLYVLFLDLLEKDWACDSG